MTKNNAHGLPNFTSFHPGNVLCQSQLTVKDQGGLLLNDKYATAITPIDIRTEQSQLTRINTYERNQT